MARAERIAIPVIALCIALALWAALMVVAFPATPTDPETVTQTWAIEFVATHQATIDTLYDFAAECVGLGTCPTTPP